MPVRMREVLDALRRDLRRIAATRGKWPQVAADCGEMAFAII